MASYYKYSASMNDRTYFTSVVTTTAGNIKRYFSNVESEIYFGDKEMEDIYQFQFSIDEKVLPIYGYNGYYASELVSGQRIIQGQFILNYTNEQEIKTTLGEIGSSVYESILAEEYHPSGGSMSDPIYNKLFDIMIGYGYYNVSDKQTHDATCQTIVGCKISGMQKVIDSTGQPIMEVYNFVAMDFIEENIVEVTQAPENKKDDNEMRKTGDPFRGKSVLPINGSDMGTQAELDAIGLANAYNKKVVVNFVTYNLGIISLDAMNITTTDGVIELLEEKGSLTGNLIINKPEMLNKLDVDNKGIEPILLSFDSICANVATINLSNLNSTIDNYFKQAKENNIEYIECTLNYKAIFIEGTKETIHEVNHPDCRIYL